MAGMSQRTHNLIILKDQSFTKNNVYIIVNKLSSSAAIIDPACDLCEITDAISRWNISLDKVLLTHSHEDHIRRVNDLVALYNCDVYISKMEADYYFYDCNNLQLFEDEDVLNVGDTRISCLLTPGHTAGSTCFLVESELFTGDTVFIEGCGICTGLGGSVKSMYQSVQKLKKRIDEHIKIYPAHTYGALPGCSMEYIKHNNIYFGFDEKQFVEFRMRKNQKNLFQFK